MTDKEKVMSVIESQPDDATYDELIRELAFERMIEKGLNHVREGKTISNNEMGRRLLNLKKSCLNG